MLTAQQFLTALGDAMPLSWPDAAIPADGGRWAGWVTRALHRAAATSGLSCCCEDGPHGQEADVVHGVPRGYNRRHVYDMTWYAAWETWELPCVAIQHRNPHRFDAWLQDHWQLQMSAVPLRVSLGFTSEPGDWPTWQALLQQVSDAHCWPAPPQTEDLVLLGHTGVTTDGMRVLARRGTTWQDAGTLADHRPGGPSEPTG